MQRRSFLATGTHLFAAFSAPLAFAQNSKPIPLKFTLDFRPNGQTAPFFLALNKGYYRDEGLDVTIDTGAGSVASITRIASGVYLSHPGRLYRLQALPPVHGPRCNARAD